MDWRFGGILGISGEIHSSTIKARKAGFQDCLDTEDRIIELFDDGEKARKLACRAREQVVATRDMRVLTERLVESYREVVREKRASR